MMATAAPRRRTSGTSTAANDEKADSAGTTAALVVMRGGDHVDVDDNNMERVFAFDYDVLYKDYVRSNIILLTIWGLYGALGVYRVVIYYHESRAATVLNGLGTACFLFLFVFMMCTISGRWKMITGQRLTLTTTGVRLDYSYNPIGPPLSIHVRWSFCRWPPPFFIGDFRPICFSPSSLWFVITRIHRSPTVPSSPFIASRRPAVARTFLPRPK
jgi:hypothetical protein